MQTDFPSHKRNAGGQTAKKAKSKLESKRKVMPKDVVDASKDDTSTLRKQQNENICHAMLKRERKPITYGK